MSKSRPIAELKIARVHPGEVLEDILNEFGLSAHAASLAMGIPANRLTAIIKGQRGITPDTALRLARYFGASAEMWINMQAGYDLQQAKKRLAKRIQAEVRPLKASA
jgi:addiction module HigA family antidote